MKLKSMLIIMFIFLSGQVFAWDGYDYGNNSYIEIERDNLVRRGQDIEIYDYDSGGYHDVTVESINRYGASVEVEVYDHETGEFRTFDMDN